MLSTCPSCGKVNRVPARHVSSKGTCGACKSPLPPPSEPIDVSDVGEFDTIVKFATSPVLVDFWAPWCGPCRMVAPEVKLAAEHLKGQAVVLKVNTDQLPELAQRYRVAGIPSFAIFKNGALVHQQAGAVGHVQLEKLVRTAPPS